jgi:hypothetical protein
MTPWGAQKVARCLGRRIRAIAAALAHVLTPQEAPEDRRSPDSWSTPSRTDDHYCDVPVAGRFRRRLRLSVRWHKTSFIEGDDKRPRWARGRTVGRLDPYKGIPQIARV